MALVVYNGNYIVPAPVFTLTENYVRAGDGTPLSASYELVFKGTLLPDIGSPRSDGTFSTTYTAANTREASINTDDARFGSIIRKQLALRNLFAINPGEPTTARAGGLVKPEYFLQILTDDANSTILRCRPMIASISFSDEINVIKNEFTITINTNELNITGTDAPIIIQPSFSDFKGYNLKSASDSISTSFDSDYEGTYTVTRSVSAQSYKVFYSEAAGSGITGSSAKSNNAMSIAKSWVGSRISSTGLYLGNYSNVVPITGYEFANYTTSEQADDFAGSYSIQQNWKYIRSSYSGVTDDYSISLTSRAAGSYGISSTNGFDKAFKISGSIKGIATGVYAYTKAKNYFDNVISASNFGVLKTRIADSNGTFNPFIVTNGSSIYGPYTMTISENRRAGTINYDAEFKEKPFSLSTSKFIDLDVTVSENRRENVIAEIPIPGKSTGPVIQDINTTNTVKRNINANFTIATGLAGVYANIDDYRSSARDFLKTTLGIYPTGTQGTHFWISNFSESVDVSKGTYVFNATVLLPGETGTI